MSHQLAQPNHPVTLDKSDDQFHTEYLQIAMGPSHPATHGTMQMILTLDGETVMDADIMNGENIRMIQGACGLCLLLKSQQSISVLGESRRQHFDCHVAIQLFIARAVHLTHPAFA